MAMGFPIGTAMGRHTGQSSQANLAKTSLTARATRGSASGNFRFVDRHRRSPVTSQSRAPDRWPGAWVSRGRGG